LLLWRGSCVESFLFMLLDQETLSTGLLNSLKRQEVCRQHAEGRNCSTSVPVQDIISAAWEAAAAAVCSEEVCSVITQQIGVSTCSCMENLSY
jgi:hypothetical protein